MESTRRARTGVLAALLSFALVTSGAVLASPAIADEPDAPIVEVVETAPPADDTEGAVEDAPAEDLPAEETPAEETPAEDAPADEDVAPSDVESAPLQSEETAPEADAFSALAVAASITPTPSSVTADGVTVRVVGAGFDGIAGAYAALIETGTEASLGMGGGYVSFGYWMPPAVQFVDGAFDRELPLAAADALDRTKTYEVIVWQGHSAPDASTIYARSALTLTPEQWNIIDPPPVPATPTVTVSATTDLDRDGQVITVTGTGFVPSPPATTGTRPPLAGSFGGAYVVFAKFGENWKPSVTGSSRPRDNIMETKWGVADASVGLPGLTTADGAFAIAADGTFSIELTVSTDEARDALAGNFGIYTYSGSGAKHAPFETFTPLTFQAPAPAAPTVTVSATTDLDRDGQTITVTGTGFVPSPPATTGTRPPLAGSFGGAYVVFAKFPDAWKPTEGVTSRPSAYVTKWGVAQAQFGGAVNAGNGGFVIAEDGSFSIDIEVSTDEARDLAAGNFGIYTYSGGGAKHAPFETFTPLAFASPAQPGPVVTAAVGGVSASEAAISVDASGLAGPVYAAIIERGTESQLTGSGGFAAMAFIPTLVDGGFERIIAVPAQNLDATKLYEVLVWTAHTMPSSTTIQGRADIAFLPEHWAVLTPGTGNPGTGNPGTGNPGTGNPGTGNPGTQPGASVSLSVAPSALNPAVANTVTVSGSGYTGAGAANGVYVNIGSSSVWQPGQVPAQSGWIVSAWVTPGQLSGGRFSVELTIPAGAMTAGGSYGAATFAAHGLSITDRSLDAWSIITIDTTQAAAVGAAGATRTPPATPPAATGLTLDRAEYTAGSRVSATASGFQPNETGIMVVLYSDPVVLSSSATADANGVVTWSGVLPAGVTGDHTLTFQGSVSVGTPIRILAADGASTDDQCTVSDATLTWGFKETFRSYVSGSIANGEWVVADGAAYETPSFSWEGSGTLDAEAESGTLAFVGSVRFTGHGGVLDTTIANPRIELTGDGGAILLLDITGTTQSGDPVSEIGVEFAELDLGAVTPVADGEALTFPEIPATLTAAGSAAFGTYEAGSALDPITLAVVLDEGCGATAVDTVSGDVTAPVAPGPDLTWLWWVIGALVLVVSIVVIVLVVRGRAAKQG